MTFLLFWSLVLSELFALACLLLISRFCVLRFLGTYTVYQGGSQIATYTTNATGATTVGSFTTTANAEIKITFSARGTVSTSPFKNNQAYQPIVVVSMYYQAQIPTDAFTLIGYDGIGLNFGTTNTVYLGAEGAILKYGNYALKVSPDGIYKQDPNSTYESWVPLSNMKVYNMTTDYSLSATDGIDFVRYNNGTADHTLTCHLLQHVWVEESM